MTDRLFVALPVPHSLQESLEVFVGPRRDASADWRWVRAENWHLTLAFVGDVPDGRQEALAELLAEVADRTKPFPLTLGGAGAFPNPWSARVLWLGAVGPGDQLPRLARRVRTACDRAGVPADPTAFSGHLTLARAHRPTEVTKILRVVDNFPELSWHVDSFHLVESQLNRGGSIYRSRQEFALGSS